MGREKLLRLIGTFRPRIVAPPLPI